MVGRGRRPRENRVPRASRPSIACAARSAFTSTGSGRPPGSAALMIRVRPPWNCRRTGSIRRSCVGSVRSRSRRSSCMIRFRMAGSRSMGIRRCRASG